MIWRGTNKFSRKAWLIMIALVVLSLVTAGLIKYYSTYSTRFMGGDHWCGTVLPHPKFGLEWYVKRKMNEFPCTRKSRGFVWVYSPTGLWCAQKMGLQEGTATIGWKDVYEWYNTPDFILVNFRVKTPKGEVQQGAYILPKRMDSRNFSFNTVRKHLKETVGEAKPL